MAPLYEISGEFTEYSTVIVEATDAETARQIWYQNMENAGVKDTNVECNVEDEDLPAELYTPDFTMDDYDEDGPKIA